MQDKVRRGLTAVWLLIGVLYLTPTVQAIDVSINGVPLFAVWATILAPLLLILLYGFNSYREIKLDKRTEHEEQTRGGGAAAGGE